jgi:hypothetical protein
VHAVLNFYALNPNSVPDQFVTGQTSRWIDQLFHDSAAAVAAAAAAETVADNNAEGGRTDRMPVEMTLKLALDYSAAGKSGSMQRVAFNKSLTQDLSNASGLLPHLFEIVRVSAGSIIVHTLIHPGAHSQK